MKKLMIVAAVAATSIAASAVTAPTDLAYDFSASLKTTTGKTGKAINTTYTVKLGKDANDVFWYNDAAIVKDNAAAPKIGIWTDAAGKVWTNVVFKFEYSAYVGHLGQDWSKMPNASKEEFAGALGFNIANADPQAASTYKFQSANKWCQTFSFVHTDGAQCYRVATSRSIKRRIDAKQDCCSTAGAGWPTWDLYLTDGQTLATSTDTGADITTVMFNRFGAQAKEKATKVEWMGTIGAGAYGAAEYYALAGQGTWGKLGKDKNAANADIYGATAISGNIVGAAAGAECEYCCQPNTAAVFFQCDETKVDPTGALANNPTAAFGTFTIKFNKRLSTDVL